MKRLAILGLALALLLGMSAMAGAVTFTVYNGALDPNAEFNWEAACSNFKIQSFDSVVLNPGVTLTTLNGVINTGDDRFDDIVVPGGATTTWSFAPQVFGVGGFFNLAGPGGPGTGIDVFADGLLAGTITNDFAGQFWGFLSDTAFTAALFAADGQPGVQETYTMDDLHYCPVPVPPAVWLFGSGLLGLIGLRRKLNA